MARPPVHTQTVISASTTAAFSKCHVFTASLSPLAKALSDLHPDKVPARAEVVRTARPVRCMAALHQLARCRLHEVAAAHPELAALMQLSEQSLERVEADAGGRRHEV